MGKGSPFTDADGRAVYEDSALSATDGADQESRGVTAMERIKDDVRTLEHRELKYLILQILEEMPVDDARKTLEMAQILIGQKTENRPKSP
jgi:hypothetical protein